ncbi:GH1 family beta-glucosidase [Nocardioides sp. AE5]|uniref:GH1 family beta-glucosidase n=1 Tax=Nocardioides sp. AE5 TaxID=2962573 RepID=UPI002880C6B8|nr:GH1 family beta-glucosidase [Nocardioides sp. AE5]MDT0203162.1 GH1 family beta-glucosidase [Nocardioides sp. AE5]
MSNQADRFLWGTATAALQIEGASHDDGRGDSSWDVFARQEGNTYRGDTADIACDHYHRWEQDLELLNALGVGAYRFSVSWPRVMPSGRGVVNGPGLDFYDRLVDGLCARGIVPMVTLMHSDLPQALELAGGWAKRETALAFAEYASVVHRRLADRVDLWLTVNEPWVMAWQGYGYGRHAPGLQDPRQAVAALHHMLLGHGLAVRAMRADGSESSFGVAANVNPVRPISQRSADVAAARRWDGHVHRSVLDPLFGRPLSDDLVSHYRAVSDFEHVRPGDAETIAGSSDFLGINYYRPEYVGAGGDAGDRVTKTELIVPEGVATTGMGWPIDPAGLTETLQRIHAECPGVPLFVTENGTACYDYPDPSGLINDVERVDFLRSHVAAALAAREHGVDLRGYFAWSLLDNFEWAEGYAQRFGLTYVDFRTQARLPKRSFHWYRDEIARRSVRTGSAAAASP